MSLSHKIQKSLCIALVILGFGLPMILRIDSWPFSDFPMFSRYYPIEHIQVLQVYLIKSDGREFRVELMPGRVGDVVIGLSIEQKAEPKKLLNVLKSVMRDASQLNQPAVKSLRVRLARPQKIGNTYGVSYESLVDVPIE